MNISGIQPALGKRSQDFNTLQNALQSGNLASAQSAFAAFLQDVQTVNQTAGPSSLFGAGTQAGKDLQALGSALKSADLAGAQKAFATLKQDVQMAGQSPVTTGAPHNRHPVAHADIASNGVTAFTSAASNVGGILNLKA
jgi:hypothetical protein